MVLTSARESLSNSRRARGWVAVLLLDWYHLKLPGGVDPDLYSAKSSASKSEHGDISRVRRGGCWADEGWPCRSAFRLRFEPERRHDHIGFRIVAVQL
ncbi:MAG: SUMF1/EgtB/PvdO family nonheme iron enzyme [Acidobacteriota bacterium]